jgi:DNA-binding HxlR family transcriptional regulator
MATPKPGKPVRGSDSGRPIMALLDLLGRRWTLRVIWELRETGIVDVAEAGGYTLSASGKTLLEAMGPLLEWSDGWKKTLRPKGGGASD